MSRAERLSRWMASAWVGVFAMSSAMGQIAVSPSGQASYAVAIGVPPGISGQAPSLSLSYVDGGINGPVGVGWSVQGISTITRCPASRAVDGVPRAVDFTGADKLCLDGQRLIQTDDKGQVSATQVDDAKSVPSGVREYRTEKDTYARIRAYGQYGPVPTTGRRTSRSGPRADRSTNTAPAPAAPT